MPGFSDFVFGEDISFLAYYNDLQKDGTWEETDKIDGCFAAPPQAENFALRNSFLWDGA